MGSLKKSGFLIQAMRLSLSMPSTIFEKMPQNTSVSLAKTKGGMSFLRMPVREESVFRIEDCDRILEENGFRPATIQESQMARTAQIRAGLSV